MSSLLREGACFGSMNCQEYVTLSDLVSTQYFLDPMIRIEVQKRKYLWKKYSSLKSPLLLDFDRFQIIFVALILYAEVGWTNSHHHHLLFIRTAQIVYVF